MIKYRDIHSIYDRGVGLSLVGSWILLLNFVSRISELRPWLEELANIAGYMSRAAQNDRKLLQESKGMVICKVGESSNGKKSVYHGLIV